jgi:hypothetical protein
MSPALNVDEELRWLRNAKPFLPLRIHLNDGRKIDVYEALQFAFNDVQVVVLARGGSQIFRTDRVTAIELLNPSPGPVNKKTTCHKFNTEKLSALP